jgi:Family of unknown function (DUF5996)
MPSDRPVMAYDQWSATCDTLHCHTQVLGKLTAVLAPPEPQLQHAALRLTARGWESNPLPLAFTRSAFEHSCAVCGWDPALPASARGMPPPVR